MKKIIIVLLFCVLYVLPAFAEPEISEPVFVKINSLKYHEHMQYATEPEDYLTIGFGTGIGQVGGPEQDKEVYTPGVPFAFRSAAEGKVWVLDSINKKLKLFTAEAEVERQLDLSKMGEVVRDFVVMSEGGFWFLNGVNGMAYRTDADGKILGEIEGFESARAIGINSMGELMVDYPIMQTILRFDSEDLLKDHFIADESLSLYTNRHGQLYGLRIDGADAQLFLRQNASPAVELSLAEIPYESEFEGVTYAGGSIMGLDAAGNVYFSLIACDEMGNIYSERLYIADEKGQIINWLEILTKPYMSYDLPRERVVTDDGRVMSFYVADGKYILCVYNFVEAQGG